MISARRIALALGTSLALVLTLHSNTLVAGEQPSPGPSAAEPATEGGEHAGDEAEHRPTPGDINYYYGMIGEKEGVEPGLLWRPKGMPVPYAAQWLNFALLFGAAYAFGKNRVRAALTKRKSTILYGIEEASKMREAAEARLNDYEDRLEHIDSEIERITQHMRESGEAERERILGEARDRRERMERDAKILIDQELEATREQLYRETVRGAMRSAEKALLGQVNIADQQRVAREYLDSVRAQATQLRGKV